jgi:hypothetical protein
MSRYKILKSVAHNWASSILSLEYFDDRGYLAQYLVDAAREQHSRTIEYNPLENTILPPGIATPAITKLLSYASADFLRILEAQGCSRDMVSSSRLRVEYSTLEPCPVVTKLDSGWSFSDPWKAPECVPYHATSTIEDDKGRSHVASVREWWRPEGAA